MVGERVILFARKNFSRGARKRLAVLIVKKVSNKYSWAVVSRIFDRKYLNAKPGELKKAIAVFGAMTASSYVHQIISQAPKASVFIGAFYSGLTVNRMTQFMPEYALRKSNIEERKEKYNQELKTQPGFQYGFSSDIYPLSFVSDGILWEVFGFSLGFNQSIKDYQIELNDQVGKPGDKTGLDEGVQTTGIKCSVNFRFPLTFSSNFYLSSILKVYVFDSHTFEVKDTEETVSQLRSVSFNFMSLVLEENFELSQRFRVKIGGGFPLLRQGTVAPNRINIQDGAENYSHDLAYDSYSSLNWYLGLGMTVKQIPLMLTYSWEKFLAVAPAHEFESTLSYQNIGFQIGYLF